MRQSYRVGWAGFLGMAGQSSQVCRWSASGFESSLGTLLTLLAIACGAAIVIAAKRKARTVIIQPYQGSPATARPQPPRTAHVAFTHLPDFSAEHCIYGAYFRSRDSC